MENSVRLGIYMLDVLHMSVKGLFGHLNYDLDFERNDGFSIIAAPNGFGKSTILKSINAVLSGNVLYFASVPFEKMSFVFCEPERNIRRTLEIVKESSDGRYEVKFILPDVAYSYSNEDIEIIEEKLEKTLKGYRRINDHQGKLTLWKHRQGGAAFRLHELYEKFYYSSTMGVVKKTIGWLQSFHDTFYNHRIFVTANRFADSFAVRLKHQLSVGFGGKSDDRTIFTVGEEDFNAESLNALIRREVYNHEYGLNRIEHPPVGPITNFSEMSKKEVYEFACEYWNKVYQLEKRLEHHRITGKEYENPCCLEPPCDSNPIRRSDTKSVLIEKIGSLSTFWKYAKSFDGFMNRLDLLESTLNKMLFFKKVKADCMGLHFIDDSGNELGDRCLSSGENQIIALLGLILFDGEYERRPMLVISDEPEVSLHPAWQEAVADFFYKASEHFHKRFILASHSPIFIGNRWNKVIDLYKQGIAD